MPDKTNDRAKVTTALAVAISKATSIRIEDVRQRMTRVGVDRHVFSFFGHVDKGLGKIDRSTKPQRAVAAWNYFGELATNGQTLPMRGKFRFTQKHLDTMPDDVASEIRQTLATGQRLTPLQIATFLEEEPPQQGECWASRRERQEDPYAHAS